jgi:outer membrane protein TolC
LLPLLVATATACGPLDLPALEALALVRSDEVRIKEADVLAAEADRAIASAARWFPAATATLILGPSQSAHGNVLLSENSNRNFTDLGAFGRIDVSVVQPLWTWGQLSSARDAAEAGVKARSLLVDDQKQQIFQRVLMLYYAVLLTNRLLALAREVEGALQQVEEKVKESLENAEGDVTQEDKYRVAIFRSDLFQKRADAEKAQTLARSALAATLALRPDQLRLLDAPLPKPQKLDVPKTDTLVDEAITNRPDLRALLEGIRAKEDQAHAARAALFPQLFLAGTFAYSRAPNRDVQTNPWIYDNFNLLALGAVLGLRQNLAIPLLLAQAEKAEAELEPLRRQQEGLLHLIRADVEKAAAELEAASKRHDAAAGGLSAGKSWFRAAGMNFSLNLTDARSLLEAYTGYVKAQIDEAQSAYEFLVARGRLDQVVAKPLETGGATCIPQ